jgi:F-type H+-transporting ATPase subunit a
MINLFSAFDPSTRIINISIKWTRTFIGIIFIPISTRFILSRHYMKFIINKLLYEFKTLLGDKVKGRTFIFIALFPLILFNNSLRLFPFVFTRTRHLTITLTLALPLWVRFILFGWIDNTNHIFEHLVPQGTTAALIPFIVCIETVWNIIRPGTLAVRLTANIIAGHPLLTLLRNNGPTIRQSPDSYTRLCAFIYRGVLVSTPLQAIVFFFLFA